MTAYGTTMFDSVTLDPSAVVGSYAVVTMGLLPSYAVTMFADATIAASARVSNYRIAFSTGGRPTIGQLWPRGAGNRI